MDRRQALKALAWGSASTVASLSCGSLLSAVANEAEPHWGYIGEGGPALWNDLSPAFSACGLGREQSPINLSQPIQADLGDFTVSYQPVPLRLIHTGHSLQVNVDADNSLTLDGNTYTLQQFHFHHPSEHTVDGASFPMELHLVHSNGKNELAVLGIFLTQGAENPTLSPIWRAMPSQKSEEIAVANTQIAINDLVPSLHSSFRYFGSLTTPPCSEVVSWVVLRTPLEVSAAQIERFREVFPLNARPLQAQHRRIVLESR